MEFVGEPAGHAECVESTDGVVLVLVLPTVAAVPSAGAKCSA